MATARANLGAALARRANAWKPRHRFQVVEGDCIADIAARRIVDAALNLGEVRAWDFQPFRDASRQYVRNSMDLDDLEAMARFPPVKGP